MTDFSHRSLPALAAAFAVAITMMAASASTATAAPCTADILNRQATMRATLADVAKRGLRGRHYYEITFLTSADGVVVPATQREKFPDSMTIVLQHQFAQLAVIENRFDVVLWFKGMRAHVTVPFNTVTHFIDPSADTRTEFDPAATELPCGTLPLQRSRGS